MRSDRAGFTLVELLVSLAVLGTIFIGLAGTAARYAHDVTLTGARASAFQLADDRIEEVRMHPNYGELAPLFEDTEFDVNGIAGAVRETAVVRRADTTTTGVIDYTTVTVRVTRPGLVHPVSRTTIVGAP